MQHLKIKVYGRVQGVFFRDSTKKKAEELNVVGLVRNEEDGTVYIEAEGSRDALDAFLDWIGEGGPPTAKVEDVNVVQGELQYFTDFSIAE